MWIHNIFSIPLFLFRLRKAATCQRISGYSSIKWWIVSLSHRIILLPSLCRLMCKGIQRLSYSATCSYCSSWSSLAFYAAACLLSLIPILLRAVDTDVALYAVKASSCRWSVNLPVTDLSVTAALPKRTRFFALVPAQWTESFWEKKERPPWISSTWSTTDRRNKIRDSNSFMSPHGGNSFHFKHIGAVGILFCAIWFQQSSYSALDGCLWSLFPKLALV